MEIEAEADARPYMSEPPSRLQEAIVARRTEGVHTILQACDEQ